MQSKAMNEFARSPKATTKKDQKIQKKNLEQTRNKLAINGRKGSKNLLICLNALNELSETF